MTTRRLGELDQNARPGAFNNGYLQAIHRYIFQDVYSWAGQFREVNIARPGQFYFAFAAQIVPCLQRTFDQLRQERLLTSAMFCNRAAYYMGELNAIHPFRDGNGRTQREFIRQFALRYGYALDWFRVSREQMYEASHGSFQRGDNAGLEAVIQQALAGGD